MNVELNLGVAAVLLGTILFVRLFSVSGCSSRSSATIVSEFQTCWQLYRKTQSSDLKPQTNEQTKLSPKAGKTRRSFHKTISPKAYDPFDEFYDMLRNGDMFNDMAPFWA